MALSTTPVPLPSRPGPAGQPTRAGVFGRGLAVLAGWYAVVVVAVALWLPTVSDVAPLDVDCSGFGCGSSPRDDAILGLLFLGGIGGPVSVVGAVTVLGLTAVRPMRSGVVAGTLAAGAGLLCVVLLALGLAL